jgi:glycosyltransferase involved in cell wall biosynthesis
MLISVIIPFRDSEAHLKACLEGIASQNFLDAEFILVDNASSDSSPEIVRDFKSSYHDLEIHLIRENKTGSSFARNSGARKAGGKWLVFMDSDCVPDPDWLIDIAALAGCIKPALSENRTSRFLGMYTLQPNEKEEIFNNFELVKGGFPTANLAVRKDIFEEIGGFDETIPFGGEDYDLCEKIYRKSLRIKALTNAVVYHRHRGTVRGLIRQSIRFGNTHARCLRRSENGIILLQLPGLNIIKKTAITRIWIDFIQADKKVAFFILTGFLWWPFWGLLIAYFLYLCRSVYYNGKFLQIPLSIKESPAFAGLLLVKSLSLTFGRLRGGIRYGVICL